MHRDSQTPGARCRSNTIYHKVKKPPHAFRTYSFTVPRSRTPVVEGISNTQRACQPCQWEAHTHASPVHSTLPSKVYSR
jgi:hypothetical protein